MNNNPSQILSLEEQLQRVQDQLRQAARQRADLIAAKASKRDLDRFDQDVAVLRQQRQSLINALDREKRAGLVQEVSENTPRTVQRRRASGEAPLIIRLFALVLVVFVVALLTISGLTFIINQLQPPPIEDALAEEQPDEFNPMADGLSFQQRVLAAQLWASRDKVYARPSDDETPVEFTVNSGETAGEVATRLAEEELVVDADVFSDLLEWRGADRTLEAGDYQLSRAMTMDEIIAALQVSARPELTFTLVEGWRAEQMAEALEQEGMIQAADYMALVNNPAQFAADFPFLNDLPAGSTLEGYLFPDTYRIFADEVTAEAIIRMQLQDWDTRVTPALRAAVAQQGLTLHQAVIIASIVEREARVSDERPTIAGVYINRLRDGTLLNADPTIQYGLGRAEDGTWWRPLTADDLALDTPYNTYIYTGLPPTPIDSPGLDALQATITAPATPYYYFVAQDDGRHIFAETYEEHLQNVQNVQSTP